MGYNEKDLICVWCGISAEEAHSISNHKVCSAPDGDGHLFRSLRELERDSDTPAYKSLVSLMMLGGMLPKKLPMRRP